MGGKSSKSVSRRSSLTSNSSWHPQQSPPYNSQGYAPPQQNYAPAQSYAAPPLPQTNGGVQAGRPQKRFDRMYSRIADNYNSLEE
ncbi:hypothetical protein MKX03_002312, partial [Papaver bracteatum]